jgi:hypothetical protein
MATAMTAKAVRYWLLRGRHQCVGCGVNLPKHYLLVRCAGCRAKMSLATLAIGRALKIAAFNVYGGRKCACCGETEMSALCLDHIDGNGNKHRLEVGGSKEGGSVAMYRWLKRHGFPAGFQVLCANCNTSKQVLGVCYHKGAVR